MQFIKNFVSISFLLKLLKKFINMKKITLIILSFMSSTLIVNSQEVLNESFDTDLSLPSGWTNESTGTSQTELWTFTDNQDFLWLFTADNNYMADYAGGSGNNALFDSNAYGAAEISDASLTSPVFDCSNLTEIKLSFGYFVTVSAAGYNGSAFVEVYDGSSWVTAAEFSETTLTPDGNGYYWDYGEALVDVSEQLVGVTNAQVRFRFSEITNQAWGMKIDNVVVQQPLGDAPDSVTDMIPADEAVDVEIILSANGSKMIDFNFTPATTGDAATTYDWWFGTTAEVTEAVAGIQPTVDITWGTTTAEGWQPNTTYYWAVEANNVAGSTLSAVQSFTTGPDDPLGLEEEVIKMFKVYPNPVVDKLFIEGDSNIDQVEIINQIGQSVIKINGQSLTDEIDLRRLNSGIYFIEFTSNNKKEIHQLIKK